MEFVKSIIEFNNVAGTESKYNTRKVGLYTGLVLEEVAEMIESVGLKESSLFDILEVYSESFKNGLHDDLIETRMQDDDNRTEYLDAAVDIAVVGLGSAVAIGADVDGACTEVMGSNLAKFPLVDGVRTVIKDSNGKVKKPEGWKSPELKQFLN